MLRSIVIALGLVCFGFGLAALVVGGFPGALMFLVGGGLVLLGTLYERVRYKPLAAARPGGTVRTDERFIDDETGKPVTVYVDPATGERTYVEE
jgi:hypothetical protein